MSDSLQHPGCSTPGFQVLHYLPEFAKTRVHWVSDAIQLSHCLLPPPPFNLSQHQGLFWQVGSSHQVAKVLELQLQHQSFQWIFRVDFFYDWLAWFLCSPSDSQESSEAPQFESINSLPLSHPYRAMALTVPIVTSAPRKGLAQSKYPINIYWMSDCRVKFWRRGRVWKHIGQKALHYFKISQPCNLREEDNSLYPHFYISYDTDYYKVLVHSRSEDIN